MLTPKAHKVAVYVVFSLLAAWLLFSSLPPQIRNVNGGGHETTKEEGDKLALYTLWLAVFTGVLAFSTIGLWIATGLTLTHSRKTAERQLRAYMSVEPDGIIDYNPNDRVVARIRFHNTGSIFAKDVCTFVDFKLSENDDLPEEALPIDETKFSGNNVIAPRTYILYATDAIYKRAIDDGRAAAQKDEKGRKNFYLYVWGKARYHDGFIAGRFTKFCHRYNFGGLPEATYKIPEQNYRYHHRGNKIDEKD